MFIKSLVSFMSTYDFNGVDLDWEYPAAEDRSGRPEDFENYPRFISNLKKALRATGGRDGLSITLPASYWYLQLISSTSCLIIFMALRTKATNGLVLIWVRIPTLPRSRMQSIFCGVTISHLTRW
jgi:hypothetical protein